MLSSHRLPTTILWIFSNPRVLKLSCLIFWTSFSTHSTTRILRQILGNAGIAFLEAIRKTASDELKASKRFDPPANIRDLAKYAEPIVSIGNQTGEGWFLTGEMMELIHNGAPNIVCTQPFGCLPNHIVGKGVIKELRHQHPEANIVAIDYDPGASEVNQVNRIKLMLATANKNLHKKLDA